MIQLTTLAIVQAQKEPEWHRSCTPKSRSRPPRSGSGRYLTDFAAYPEWNPFIPCISGPGTVGSRLDVQLQPPGGRGMQLRPTVLAAAPSEELRWLGQLGVPGLFDGEHRFRIEPLGGGSRALRSGRALYRAAGSARLTLYRAWHPARIRGDEPGAQGARRTAFIVPLACVPDDRMAAEPTEIESARAGDRLCRSPDPGA